MAEENRRVKKIYAGLAMQNELLKFVPGIKATRPSQRRQMAKKAVRKKGAPAAEGCRAGGVSET